MPELVVSSPMYERRPEWLGELIDKRRNNYLDIGYRLYGNNGTQADYYFDEHRPGKSGVRSMQDTIKELEADLGRKLRILEMGAGAGAFVLRCLENGHDAYGLSLGDFREASPALLEKYLGEIPDEAYVVDDAHRLSKIPELAGDFDFIISRYLFIHLADELGTLEQAANKVRAGGMLAIDCVQSDNPRYYHPEGIICPEDILDSLQQAGFDTRGSGLSASDDAIIPLIARRDTADVAVRFPFRYRTHPDPDYLYSCT